MSHIFEGFDLKPRNGVELLVLIIARISTVHQDARSLDDQVALCEGYVRSRYPGPIRLRIIQGRGSDEALDRRDLADAELAVESEAYDLAIVEDLGRHLPPQPRHRLLRAHRGRRHPAERQQRLDRLRPQRNDWRLNAFFANFKHESGNSTDSILFIRFGRRAESHPSGSSEKPSVRIK